MHPADKELLIRVAPAYVLAGIAGVAAFIQVRQINRQAKLDQAEHEIRMEELKKAARERMERHEAWRATQPKTAEEFIAKAKEKTGSVDDVRRKMEDPNHTWEL